MVKIWVGTQFKASGTIEMEKHIKQTCKYQL